MRLKQTSALLLAGVMLVGSIGIMNPTEVRAADATNTFTLTVPADTNITTSGWNDIGSVGVSNVSIASDKKISVTIGGGATGRTLKKTGEVSKTVGYEIKKGNATTNEAFGTSLDFTANGTQAIGAMVDSFAGKPAGNYTDTITFTAKLEDKVTALTMKNASGKTLAAADLGAPSEFTVNGKTYYAYNDFIKKTSGSNWDDAMNFVKMLNYNEYGGYKDWILINDVVPDGSIYKSAIGKAWYVNYCYSGTDRGGVNYFWSSVAYNADNAFLSYTYEDGCGRDLKSDSSTSNGFLVLRGPSNASAPAEVTYTRTDGSGTLSSANLGEPTSWTYNTTTYQVYNAFIPSSSGSSWNDAMGFVKALKDAEYDGHDDWQLLGSKEMATAWYNEFSTVNRGDVDFLWSSVGDGTVCAYYLRCDNQRGWYSFAKSYEYSYCGFVVLRGSSNATEVTYTRTDSTGTLSSANLGTPTEWTYDNKKYEVYNGFILSSSGSSWNDAKGFVGALNTANYGGHNDWKLLDSNEMATAWNNTFKDSVNRGVVNHLWSSDEDADGRAYRLDCRDGDWSSTIKTYASTNYGFVVLRGSSN